jgi:hypothetical protein
MRLLYKNLRWDKCYGQGFYYRYDPVPGIHKRSKYYHDRHLHYGRLVREVLHEDFPIYGRACKKRIIYYLGAWEYPYESDHGSKSWKCNRKVKHQWNR